MLTHFEDAIRHQEILVEREPNLAGHQRQLAGILRDYAWLRVFCGEAEFVDPMMAGDLAERSLAFHPRQPTTCLVRGAASYRTQQYERAAAAIREALDLHEGGLRLEDEDLARLFLAGAQAKLGDYLAVKEELHRAQRILNQRKITDAFRQNLLEEVRLLISPETTGASGKSSYE